MRDSFEVKSNRADKEVEVFAGYCRIVLIKPLPYSKLGDVSDAANNQLWDVDFGGVSIIANKDFTEFTVGHEVYYPGNYYEPDSSDYTEDGNYPTLQEALWVVLRLFLQWDYNNWLESQWAEECFGELEEE